MYSENASRESMKSIPSHGPRMRPQGHLTCILALSFPGKRAFHQEIHLQTAHRSSTPTLTPSSLPPFLRQEPCIIQGLSWLLVACPSPFPFHLLHAPHSPISCRSSLLGFLLLFVLYLPHTLSYLLIPFFPALLSSLSYLQVMKDHSLEGIASTSNTGIQMQKHLH